MMNNYGTPTARAGQRRRRGGDRRCDGKSYLDLLGGIAVNILGHRHPADHRGGHPPDSNTLGHTSNLYATEPGIALAEALRRAAWAPRRGCSSATPAPRPTRRPSRSRGSPGARNSLPPEGAFHGRTMGSLALTGQPAKQAPFEPLPGDVTHVPYGDIDALAAAVDDQTAAVFLEPIMGEGGVVVPPAGYLVAAREITATHGALLVLDEVQTGIGRTGSVLRPPARRHHARRRDAGQGARRRAADRCVPRGRHDRGSVRHRACTAARSAAIRSARPRRWRCSRRSPTTI